jgi:hypothetical protein
MMSEPLSGDAYGIELGIYEADLEERVIDDTTARMTAAQMHGGMVTKMYSLASSGAIDSEGLDGEISRDLDDEHMPEDGKRWLGYLALYVQEHGDRGPVAGWSRLWREVSD